MKKSSRKSPRKWAPKIKNRQGPIGPAQEWDQVREGDGTEHPDLLTSQKHNGTVERTFCFIDLVGFTGYTREKGLPAALDLIDEFRLSTRQVAAARGVRVTKWLGDGAFLVSVDPGPSIATAAHLVEHFKKVGIEMRIGMATGPALFLDDDYVGESVNLAAKLCQVASTGQILANVDKEDLPDWVNLAREISITIRGVGKVGGIFVLEPDLGK